jgi:uncharacterized membrane protein YvbJ
MFCKKCGAQNEDNAAACVSCSEKLQEATTAATVAAAPQPQIQSYLVFAIVVTVLCCIPFGIPAIVYAAQVSGKVASGNIEGALESSRKAKMWCWIAFVSGLAFMIIYMAINFLYFAAAATQN